MNLNGVFAPSTTLGGEGTFSLREDSYLLPLKWSKNKRVLPAVNALATRRPGGACTIKVSGIS